ncbi:hypothetical protein SNEBB_004110 [Seison nebaliae]|nr:hypothetical protein SNEBB_004110 [Seison nebaliae]
MSDYGYNQAKKLYDDNVPTNCLSCRNGCCGFNFRGPYRHVPITCFVMLFFIMATNIGTLLYFLYGIWPILQEEGGF